MAVCDTRPSVLIVDDELGPRESLRVILEPAHQVFQCARGSEALAILADAAVDVVTVDLHMPGMKGEELVGTIRRRHPEIELIAISGCGSVARATDAVRQGASEYLPKPFEVADVTAAVGRAVARRRRRADLADSIAHVDRLLSGHPSRVAGYASLLGERLRLGAEAVGQIRMAALLHDLGKVGLPRAVLLRRGALAPEERLLVELHPEMGARMVESFGLPSAVALAVRHHHEWWDGGGYPDAIAAGRIPLAARILAVADAFDAMTSDSPYRRALPGELARAELGRWSGSQFDPLVANELLSCLDQGACRPFAETTSDPSPGASHAPAAA